LQPALTAFLSLKLLENFSSQTFFQEQETVNWGQVLTALGVVLLLKAADLQSYTYGIIINLNRLLSVSASILLALTLM
jgi:hypothetical protein